MLLEYFIDDGLAQNNNHLAPKSNFNFFYFIGKEIKKKKMFLYVKVIKSLKNQTGYNLYKELFPVL